jgi:hypothetical protein
LDRLLGSHPQSTLLSAADYSGGMERGSDMVPAELEQLRLAELRARRVLQCVERKQDEYLAMGISHKDPGRHAVLEAWPYLSRSWLSALQRLKEAGGQPLPEDAPLPLG